MASVSVVAVVVLLACSALCAEDDPSCFPQPGEKRVHAGDCCDVKDSFPESMKEAHGKCKDKVGLPPPPKEHPTGPPPPEIKNKFICAAECVFEELSLLTEDKQLNEEAIRKYFSSEDADLQAVKKAAIDKCLSTYKEQIDSSLDCKSGAAQFKKCLGREVFMNCPAARYKGGEDCDGLKEKVPKCPNMPLHLGPPPPHHKPE
uniref:Odorant-binding protein 17 n=1 Tax=Matsumurasca onukii TaxID=2912585 RepID=A0A343WGY2_MATON|nr:odorant-binding protein 17 [Matsumurasca onukii]